LIFGKHDNNFRLIKIFSKGNSNFSTWMFLGTRNKI